jgi:phosphoribosylformylglycinamidine synthase
MKRYLPHIGIALGIALAVYALFFSESDEDKIRALFNRLEDAVRVTEDDTNLVVRAAHIKGEFTEIFTKDVNFEIPELINVKTGRAELAGLAAKAPQMWRTASVNLDDLGITLDDPGNGAVAVGNAVLDATRHDGQLTRDTRNVSIRLEKIEGDWRIIQVTVSAKDDTT